MSDAVVSADTEGINIDEILNEINSAPEEGQTTEVAETEADVLMTAHIKEDGEIDLEDDNSLSAAIIKNSLDVIKDAKKIFTSMSDDVLLGRDKSQASKEAMIKALDVQNSANANMIALAKVLAAKSKNMSGTNIQINTITPRQAGINLNNIKANL